MSLHEFLREDPCCEALLDGAVLAVAPLLPDPDPAPVKAVVEGWVMDLAGRMPLPWNFHQAIDALNRYLFVEAGLEGDRDTYDDPANALLPRVIERRKGMPITLSILWIEVARRLGFRAVGAALPGHFIVGLETDLGILHFDPFSGGEPVGEEGAARLVERATGGRIAFAPSMLQPVSNRAILTRLVRNLHVRFFQIKRWDEALWTATHLVLLNPEDGPAHRERAVIHFHRGEFEEGMQDLKEAIRLGADLDPGLARWIAQHQGG